MSKLYLSTKSPLVNLLNRLPSPQKETAFVRLFGLTRVPILAFLWPKVNEITQNHAKVTIPLTFRSQNHLKSMYFASLCAGAETPAGLLAIQHILKTPQPVALIFKDFQAQFHQTAETDILFECHQGEAISQAIDQSIEKNQRQNIVTQIQAKNTENQLVADFQLTMSVKPILKPVNRL